MKEQSELKTECRNKAKELVKENLNFVSGWTTTNRPDEAPSAVYEGKKMEIGRAVQCAKITVKMMLEEHSCHTLNDNRWAYWAQVDIELNNLTLMGKLIDITGQRFLENELNNSEK